MLALILSLFFGFDLPSLRGEPLFDGEVDPWLPCKPGLTITYALSTNGVERATVIETVRGRGAEPRLCVIDRRITYSSGEVETTAWAREHLPDRVANAGWADMPTAFRPPLIKAPIKKGAKWHFNRADHEIAGVGSPLTTRAGTFRDVVRIEVRALIEDPSAEKGSKGPLVSEQFYARDVGLVLSVRGEERMEAVLVRE